MTNKQIEEALDAVKRIQNQAGEDYVNANLLAAVIIDERLKQITSELDAITKVLYEIRGS